MSVKHRITAPQSFFLRGSNRATRAPIRRANPTVTADLFSSLDHRCRQIHAWRDRLERLEARVESLRRRVTGPEGLGHRVAPPEASAPVD